MVSFGAVPCSCLKIGMETFQIISTEHKISQARLAHVKSKNQYFVYFVQEVDGCYTFRIQAMIIMVFLLCLASLNIVYFLFEDNECCDKSTELPRDDERDSSRKCKRFGAAALWANTKVGKPFLTQHSTYSVYVVKQIVGQGTSIQVYSSMTFN